MKHTSRTLVLFTTLTLCACSNPTPEAPPPTAVAPSVSPSATPTWVEAATVSGDTIAGKVAETMNSGGYTYVAVEVAPGQRVWAAGPPAEFTVGESVSFAKGAEMKEFTSKTLNKTFASIYFVPTFGKGRSAPSSMPASKPSARPKTPAAPFSVAKAEGGHSVEEVFAQAKGLTGKEVVVRGKVVKFSGGIMGANWVHIQDGTGDPASKTHDLTVTTQEVVAVGDVVTVKGTVASDKDFGAGYVYSVIVEEASVTREP